MSMLFRDRAIIPLETVDSTNNYAASLIKLSRPPEGTVITAQEQTTGRGQRGTVWSSEKGENLLCSIILYPSFLTSGDSFSLSECISLAVADLAEELTDSEIRIKWPNDIMAGDQKIAGILIECIWHDSRIQSAVCGIGLNINQTVFEWPNATSIRLLNAQWSDPEKCLEKLMQHIERQYIRLKSGSAQIMHESYQRRLFRQGVRCQFRWKGQLIHAMIVSTNTNGTLNLQRDNGDIVVCDLKEISMIV